MYVAHLGEGLGSRLLVHQALRYRHCMHSHNIKNVHVCVCACICDENDMLIPRLFVHQPTCILSAAACKEASFVSGSTHQH